VTKKPPLIDRFPAAIQLTGLGWYLAVCIAGGIVGGALADSWLDTKPVLTLAGLFIGLGSAFYGGYKLLMQVISTRTTNKDSDA
jgi:F0F1-type ATP synthase assembly protein I